MNNKILVISGPTAVGKTSLSIKLAKALNGEIVSADSMQIYKFLNIGTAKPTQAEMDGIPHHMIDVCHPGDRFSVAQYVKAADEAIADIISRGRVPVIVGGTGLYIDNLIVSNSFSEVDIDLKIREELMSQVQSNGSEALLDKLKEIDPDYASKLHVNDVKRIVHALEIFYSTGKTHTMLIEESRKLPPKYTCLYVTLDCESREALYNRINSRVDMMLEEGLLEEAEQVLKSEWYEGSTASQAIGYKEFESYFNGTGSLRDAVELLKQRSRNYAKRQLTWFRHNGMSRFYTVNSDGSNSNEILERIMKDFSEL